MWRREKFLDANTKEFWLGSAHAVEGNVITSVVTMSPSFTSIHRGFLLKSACWNLLVKFKSHPAYGASSHQRKDKEAAGSRSVEAERCTHLNTEIPHDACTQTESQEGHPHFVCASPPPRPPSLMTSIPSGFRPGGSWEQQLLYTPPSLIFFKVGTTCP